MGGVEHDRRQQRRHFALEELPHPDLLRLGPDRAAQKHDVLGGQCRDQGVVKQLVLAGDEVVCLARDTFEGLLRRHAVRARFGLALHDLVLQRTDPHLEEFVEIAGGDAQVAQSLQQGNVRIFGFFLHATIESQQAGFTVEQCAVVGCVHGRFLNGGQLPASAGSARGRNEALDRIGTAAEEMPFHLFGEVLACPWIGEAQTVLVDEHGLVLEPGLPRLL